MAALSDTELRTKLDRRFSGLSASRQPYESHAEEVARYCQPRLAQSIRALNVRGGGSKGSTANNKLYNSASVRAFRTLTNGMSSGMSSPSQPWFKLRPDDPELAEFQPVKEWLDDVEAALYSFMASTTLYTTMQSGYRELGLFGTEAGLMVPHWRWGAQTTSLTFGEFWIGQDEAGRTDTLFRDIRMTVGQYAERFPKEKWSNTVKQMHDRGTLDATVLVRHAIEPNEERTYGKLDKVNMPYRSVYYEVDGKNNNGGILSVGGFLDRPFWAPRWDVQGSDVYGLGVGFDVLPDARKLQLQELKLQQAMDFTVKPALSAPPQLRNTGASLTPGGVTYVASQDRTGNDISAIWNVNPAAIPNISADIARTEEAIYQGSYADLFMAITNMRGVQPRNIEEIARRHEEQLSQLGPVVDRVQVEKLQVIVMQAFRILAEANALPPVPDELNGRPLNIEFVSVLAQAQRMIGLGNIERLLGLVGNVAGLYPAILAKVDFDQTIDEYGQRLGIPARIVRSDDAVAEIRAAQEQQEAVERAAAMAPAAKDGAQAAEILSRVDAAGQTPLERIMPGA